MTSGRADITVATEGEMGDLMDERLDLLRPRTYLRTEVTINLACSLVSDFDALREVLVWWTFHEISVISNGRIDPSGAASPEEGTQSFFEKLYLERACF